MSSDEDEETVSQNEKKYKNKRIKWYFRWNNWQIKILWRPNKSLEKVESLGEYWHSKGFGDKKLESKYFKIKFVHMSNIIDKELFEQIFCHTLEKLAKKIIYTTNKEENQIIVKHIDKSRNKIYEMDSSSSFVIQSSNRLLI